MEFNGFEFESRPPEMTTFWSQEQAAWECRGPGRNPVASIYTKLITKMVLGYLYVRTRI